MVKYNNIIFRIRLGGINREILNGGNFFVVTSYNKHGGSVSFFVFFVVVVSFLWWGDDQSVLLSVSRFLPSLLFHVTLGSILYNFFWRLQKLAFSLLRVGPGSFSRQQGGMRTISVELAAAAVLCFRHSKKKRNEGLGLLKGTICVCVFVCREV